MCESFKELNFGKFPDPFFKVINFRRRGTREGKKE